MRGDAIPTRFGEEARTESRPSLSHTDAYEHTPEFLL
jgi:hypothetical protein